MFAIVTFIIAILLIIGFYLFGPVDEINKQAKKSIEEMQKKGYTLEEIKNEFGKIIPTESKETEQSENTETEEETQEGEPEEVIEEETNDSASPPTAEQN